MNLTSLRTMVLSLAMIAAGCAGAQVTQQSSVAPITTTPPTAVVIYPFAVSAADVSLNSSIFQVAYRNMSGEDQSAQQLDIARQTAQNICVQVAANLTQKGITTTCLQRGVPPTGNNVLILDGEFTDISEGNRLRRMVIGLGAGARVASLRNSVSWINIRSLLATNALWAAQKFRYGFSCH